MIFVGAFPVEVVFGKLAFVCVFIAEFEDANTMFHAAAPVALILCSGEKVVPSIAMNLVINKAPGIFLAALVGVLPPAVFDTLFHLPLVHITISIFYAIFILPQLLFFNFLELVLELF